MASQNFKISAAVWLYPGDTAWHFVSVPKKESEQIKALQGKKLRRGFGAVKVEVKIGKTSWKTSIFPDKKSGQYLLPLKAEVRKKEGVMANDTIEFSLRLV